MNEQEKSAELAERLMGFHDAGYAWADESEEVLYLAWDWLPVSEALRWQPFQNIAQAKEVQSAVEAQGYTVRINHHVGFPYQAHLWNPSTYGPIYSAEADTEAAAICDAAGRALGLWEDA